MIRDIELKAVEFACRRLSVSRARFYGLAREGILPPGVIVRLGRHVRVNPLRLDDFIESGGAALAGGWRRRNEGEA